MLYKLLVTFTLVGMDAREGRQRVWSKPIASSYAQKLVASCLSWVTKTHEDEKLGSRLRRNRRSMS